MGDIPGTAANGADIVSTDVWTSMGDESENEERKKIFKSYQVNMNLMSKAKKDSIFLHCLPAHRGEEIDDIIIDSDYSAVWQQAHNRLYLQVNRFLLCGRAIPFIGSTQTTGGVQPKAKLWASQVVIRFMIDSLSGPFSLWK